MLAESIWQSLFGMPQIAVIMGCLIPIAAIAFSFMYKSQRDRSDNELKRAMVERGMNAEEIERIMAARTEDDPENDQG